MEALDYWRLCDELTVIEAAILVAGGDPYDQYEFSESIDEPQRPPATKLQRTLLR